MKFSVRLERLKPSAIRAVQKKISEKGEVISFAAGLPDPDYFPIEDLKISVDSMMDKKGAEAFQYGMTKGYDPLIDKIAQRLNEKEGIQASKENIIITTGSQQGLALAAMLFLDEGDILVSENPSYLGAINAARPYGTEFIGVTTDDYGMDTEELRKTLEDNPKVKLIYVIPDFQNPTGKAWSLERRKAFMDVIKDFDVMVIEDNPYGEIRFKGEKIPTLKSLDKTGQVIYLGSFSKILSPGLRLAYICADKDVINKAETIKEGWDLQCTQFTQLMVLEYIEKFDIDAHIDEIKATYKKRCELMLEEIEKEFPDTVKYTKPDGGMFVWAELPEKVSADDVLNKALDNGVAFVPGASFFTDSGHDNTLRLNFTTVSEEEIKKGIRLLGEVLREEC